MREREFSCNQGHWEKLELIPTLFVGSVFVLKLKKRILTPMEATECEIRSLFIKSKQTLFTHYGLKNIRLHEKTQKAKD